MGYYGDERAAERAGYIPFSKRPGFAEAMERVDHDRPRVKCMSPADIPGEELSADIVIVGTGAGGAMLARELAERGREVLLLERGPHVEPRDFTENEAEQLSSLYADGALTMSTDFNFHVAQGMCVGGSTVVNNAVCFDLPAHVLDRWLAPQGLNAGTRPRPPGRRLRARARLPEGLRSGPARHAQPGRATDHRWDQGHGAFRLQARRVQHRRLPRLRLLQYRLRIRKEALPPGLDAAPSAKAPPGSGAHPARVSRREGAHARFRASGVQARLADGRRLTVDADNRRGQRRCHRVEHHPPEPAASAKDEPGEASRSTWPRPSRWTSPRCCIPSAACR